MSSWCVCHTLAAFKCKMWKLSGYKIHGQVAGTVTIQIKKELENNRRINVVKNVSHYILWINGIVLAYENDMAKAFKANVPLSLSLCAWGDCCSRDIAMSSLACSQMLLDENACIYDFRLVLQLPFILRWINHVHILHSVFIYLQ